ncbi:MAG: DnaD domain protein [Oscillospiraceae bacterium]|nr:DnaD domain protein [Oscillospiraceae bacterium]
MDQRAFTLPAPPPVMVEGAALDRLIEEGDGDCALVYLYALRKGGEVSVPAAAAALKRTAASVFRAVERLCRMKLLVLPEGRLKADAPAAPGGFFPAPDLAIPAGEEGKPVLEPEGPPEYSAEDVAQEMESGSPFPSLVAETQRRLGKVLSSADLKILLGIYDYLDLPAEVISLLVTYCAKEAARAPGGGRPLRMRRVEKEAYRWKRQGADTLERAMEHLKKLERQKEQSAEILRALQIFDRPAAPSERKYIEGWMAMGFPVEAVALAYDKTVLQTGDLKWPYLNSILKRWHEKNLHTVREIEAGDGPGPKKSRSSGPAAPSSGGSRDLEAIAWMKELVSRQEREE